MEAVARAARDPLIGPLKLGVIPTLAPYLMPILLKPLRQAYPGLTIELWEDQTRALIDGLRNHRLDAALLATAPDAPEITEIALFDEPLLAALPLDHSACPRRHRQRRVPWRRDAGAGGRPLPGQPRPGRLRQTYVSPRRQSPQRSALQSSMQAATLETLVNLVAAGYGATLIPALAADSLGQRGIALRPLAGQSSRTIRLASRPGFSPPTGSPRPGKNHPPRHQAPPAQRLVTDRLIDSGLQTLPPG